MRGGHWRGGDRGSRGRGLTASDPGVANRDECCAPNMEVNETHRREENGGVAGKGECASVEGEGGGSG